MTNNTIGNQSVTKRDTSEFETAFAAITNWHEVAKWLEVMPGDMAEFFTAAGVLAAQLKLED